MTARTKQKKENIVLSMDDSVWQEIAKWFAGVVATLAVAFGAVVRSWAGERFDNVNKRLDKHDETIAEHADELAKQNASTQLVLLHIEKSEKDRARIESSVTDLRKENLEGFKLITERLDRIVEHK